MPLNGEFLSFDKYPKLHSNLKNEVDLYILTYVLHDILLRLKNKL